ncbi:MAG: hypothetical protein AAFV43_02860 [Planctomycetota bacterium]
MDQPDPKAFGRHFWVVYLVAIPVTAFALFELVSALDGKVPDFDKGLAGVPLFEIALLLSGLGMMLTPSLVRRLADRFAYVITDRRAIVFARGPTGSSVRSWLFGKLKNVQLNRRKDGSGDLIFDRELSRSKEDSARPQPVGFLAISRVEEVDALLKELVSKA